MGNEFVVLTAQDSFGVVYKVYSSDLKNFFGDYYSERDVYNKLSALYKILSTRKVA